MKKLFTLFAITAIGIATVNAQVPNPSFENWTGYLPDGWYVTFSGSSQSTQAHTGTKALKMNPWSGPNYGSITNCPQSGNKFSLGGLQPTALTGWYISNLVNGDMVRIVVSIYSNGSVIGSGNGTITTNSAAYTQFNIPVTVFSSNPADSAYIQITQNTSSYGVSGLNPATYIILDDINFDGVMGLNAAQTKNNTVNIFPNPTNGSFVIHSKNNDRMEVSIRNSLGQEVLKKTTSQTETPVDLSNFSNGIYYVRVLNNGILISEEKIIRQ